MALLGAATSTKVMINVCCLLFNKDCCHFSGEVGGWGGGKIMKNINEAT